MAGFAGLVGVKGLLMVAVGLWTVFLWRQTTGQIQRKVLLYIPAAIGCLWTVASLWNAALMAGVVG
jgi:uncharacterized membrane protein YqjE